MEHLYLLKQISETRSDEKQRQAAGVRRESEGPQEQQWMVGVGQLELVEKTSFDRDVFWWLVMFRTFWRYLLSQKLNLARERQSFSNIPLWRE